MGGFAGGGLGEVAASFPSARRPTGAARSVGRQKLLGAFGATDVREALSAARLRHHRRGEAAPHDGTRSDRDLDNS